LPASDQPLGTEDWDVLWAEVSEAFSPGAPVQERDLFAGRIPQLQALMDAVHQRGRHAIVFGERGVGKTSLTNILSLILRSPRRDLISVRVNADPQDSFVSIWKKVFRRLSYEVQTEAGAQTRSIADNYGDQLSPDDVQLELGNFSASQLPLIVLDEFDRLQDKSVTRLVADTIKALSDYSVNATVIIVGVAENVQGLIEGHESISRSLIQVRMPRMSQDELGEIIVKRYRKLGFKIDEEALWKATFLSRGLPYYAQLIGMHAARQAIQNRSLSVKSATVDAALRAAIGEIDQSIKERYYAAIRSQRSEETLYEPVLLACALAATDELGGFQQAAVAVPLSKIVPGKSYQATTFAFHMNAFCEDARRRVLERVGEPRNYRYRFTDPMMQPFVILKGLADGRINDEVADVFANRRQLRLSLD
jgi:Cdc6-like AAA superfamily ATPase